MALGESKKFTHTHDTHLAVGQGISVLVQGLSARRAILYPPLTHLRLLRTLAGGFSGWKSEGKSQRISPPTSLDASGGGSGQGGVSPRPPAPICRTSSVWDLLPGEPSHWAPNTPSLCPTSPRGIADCLFLPNTGLPHGLGWLLSSSTVCAANAPHYIISASNTQSGLCFPY